MSGQIMLSAPGGQEWLLIFLIVLLLFGAKRLPEVARGLGSGIRELKKSMNEETTEKTDLKKNESDLKNI
jgi:sec-independent protein translocase protein TatA